MPRCSNCSFALILREKSRKYKCNRCSRRFPQKETENREFKIWNEKQRDLDKHNIVLENKKVKLTAEEKKEKSKGCSRQYYEHNKEIVMAYVKEWRNNNRERRNKAVNEYRANNPMKIKLRDRINMLRQKQKKLFLQHLKTNDKTYSRKLEDWLSTFGLSEVLSFYGV